MLLNLGGVVSDSAEPEDALRHIEGIAGALGRLEECGSWAGVYDAPMLGVFAAVLHDAAAVLAVELGVAEREGVDTERRG